MRKPSALLCLLVSFLCTLSACSNNGQSGIIGHWRKSSPGEGIEKHPEITFTKDSTLITGNKSIAAQLNSIQGLGKASFHYSYHAPAVAGQPAPVDFFILVNGKEELIRLKGLAKLPHRDTLLLQFRSDYTAVLRPEQWNNDSAEVYIRE